MTEQTSLQTENKKLSRSENKARLRQIIEILNKHEVVKGLTPEKLRAILEDLGPPISSSARSCRCVRT